MCIAIYIPEGKDIKDEQIRNAFANNKDGAGVMHYDRHGQVHYAKGFMDVETLIKYWRHSTSSKYPRAIHCRIATSGKVSKGCCHPFPITDDLDIMLQPQGISTTGCLIHNGVFSRYTPKEGMLSRYSDTMVFTKKVIYPLREVLNNSGIDELMSDMTSKVLVFLPNYEVHRYGRWEFDKEGGFYASNDTYDYNYGDWKRWYNNGAHYCSYLPYSYDKPYTCTTKKDDVKVYDTCSGSTFSLPKTTHYDDLSSYDKEPTDGYGIIIQAKTMEKAQDLVDDFIDKYWDSLIDGGWEAIDTLESFDDDHWIFYVQTHQDISKDLDSEKYVLYEHIELDEFGEPKYDDVK